MDAILDFLGGLAGRVLALALAITAAQFPLFYDAYSHTLAGAQHEAQQRYEELEREAGKLHISVESFIVRHEVNPDTVFQASGRMHRTTLQHHARYSAMLNAVLRASAWEKPVVLKQNFDKGLFSATRFTPGLPLTVEGGVYALIGLLLGWAIATLIGAVLRPVQNWGRVRL